MKKLFIALIAIMTAILVGLFYVHASPTSGKTGDCDWRLEGTTLYITGEGAMADYYTLTSAPWGNEITEVIIDEGVTNIGNMAFYMCSKLEQASISESVTIIGESSFRYTKLESIIIPKGVKTIKMGAFESCTNLKEVIIEGNLTYIGDYSFQSCQLDTINIPKSVNYIGHSAFNYASVKDVWYEGSETDRKAVDIKGYNAGLLYGNTWHYNSCPVNEHKYDNDSDVSCNNCEYMRPCPVGDFNCDLIVTDADALYLLRHTLFADRYPISQSGDVNGDGETTDADALYLLRFTLFPDRYPLLIS